MTLDSTAATATSAGAGAGIATSPVTLYTVNAVIVMDNGGERILAKYYPHDEFAQNRKQQDRFEQTLFSRTRKSPNNEVVMCEGRIVVFRANLDLLVYVAGAPEQNELMLATVLDTYCDVLSELIKPQLDKRALLEHYDLAVLILDECVDRGIILETDVMEIVNKMGAGKSATSFVDMPLNEQTLSSAFSFAKRQLKTFLR